MGESSCCTCCGRVVLTVVNILFVIIGLALTVVGALLKAGTSVISESLGKIAQNLDDLGSVLDGAAVGIIVVGCIVLVIGILGCCGACYEIRWMLVVYAFFIIVIVLAEVICVALFFTKQSDVKTLLSGQLKDVFGKYKEPTANGADKDLVSRGLDGLFISLQCCGFSNYTDLGTPKFKQPPVTCCKDFTMDAVDQLPSVSPALAKCKTGQTSVNSNKDKGCYEALLGFLDNYKAYLIGGGVGVLVIELLCIIFAFLICAEINKKNKVHSM